MKTFGTMKKKSLTKEQYKEQVDKIVDHYRKVDGMIDQLKALGVMDYNGKFFDAIWTMFDTLLDEIDPDGWIAWYIFDNECGKKEHMAHYDGKSKPIKNTKDLAKILKWANKN